MLKPKLIVQEKKWEKFVLSIEPNVFLQSWAWGEFHRRLGKKIWRYGFWRKNKLVGVALIVQEDAKRGRYLACPGGPLAIKGQEQAIAQAFKKLVAKLARSQKASFVRIRPNWLDSAQEKTRWRKLGFVKAPMHFHAETTWQLPLNQSEENLLAQMRKSTRYSIRKAEREGVRVVKTTDPKKLKHLFKLQQETADRSHFVPFPDEFIETQFRQLAAVGQANLFLAKYEGKVLAASMFIFYGDTAVYHYSGSTRDHSEAFPSYAIQWAAIKEAKKKGCLWYNFWGIAPEGRKKHRFSGVTTFKKGFGGQSINYLPAHDLPTSPKYWLTFAFETYRRVSRGL